MVPNTREHADFLALAIKHGLLEPDAAVDWACEIVVAEEDPLAVIVDLAGTIRPQPGEVIELLDRVPGSADPVIVFRRLLGFMLQQLQSNAFTLARVTIMLRQLVDAGEVPEDLARQCKHFDYVLQDAEEGWVVGSVDKVRRQLIDFLETESHVPRSSRTPLVDESAVVSEEFEVPAPIPVSTDGGNAGAEDLPKQTAPFEEFEAPAPIPMSTESGSAGAEDLPKQTALFEEIIAKVTPVLHAKSARLMRHYDETEDHETEGQYGIMRPPIETEYFDERGIVLVDHYTCNGDEFSGSCLVLLADGTLAEMQRSGSRSSRDAYWSATILPISPQEAVAKYGLESCLAKLTTVLELERRHPTKHRRESR